MVYIGVIRIMSRYMRAYRNLKINSGIVSSLNRTLVNNKVANVDHLYPQSCNRKFMINRSFDENKADEIDDYSLIEFDPIEEPDHTRNLLFKDSTDLVINDLNRCASVEDVLNFIRENSNLCSDKYLTQAVLVLRDLQNVFYQYKNLYEHNNVPTSTEFIKKLLANEEFLYLLDLIKNKLDEYDVNLLSYTFLYLYKLGISIENELMCLMSIKIRDYLLVNFDIEIVSRYLNTIFSENSIRPYYLSINLMPQVVDHIEKCITVGEFEHLTTSLNKLHNIITKEVLQRYKLKVQEFLNQGKLTGQDFKTILRIVLFLNYPEWRNQSSEMISSCMLIMKDHIGYLNLNELLMLYEVFFKNQEPGDILNNIQRCSAKYLQQLDNAYPTHTESKLKLFSSLIYFSSPTHRIQFRRDVQKYARECKNLNTLILLRKVYSYIKVSDPNLCNLYWTMSLDLLKNETSLSNVVKVAENYMNFNIDIDNYRDYISENEILKIMEHFTSNNDIGMYPPVFFSFLSFAIVYGKNWSQLEVLIKKLENMYTQMSPLDCLKLSQSLYLQKQSKCSYVTKKQLDRLNTTLSKVTEALSKNETNILKINLLIKSSILRGNIDNVVMEDMLFKFKEMDFMSSKVAENICYTFVMLGALIPEVINKCTEYVINNKENILGFNAEKLLYMCYYLAYYPINDEQFFETIIDIIIRDQERLSGLAFLQAALSLCFYNKLPSSFIKAIFNVEFLDRIDMELANCYSKDKYPQRVRNCLMQLNRAVCLEYPEANIPWFHQKYAEELLQKVLQDESSKQFFIRVKDYLVNIMGSKEFVLENVITPYGYHIDFVVHLDSSNQPVIPLCSNEDQSIVTRLAILLVKEHMFTKFYTHLKGKYEMKKRHLEILGYKVSIIKFQEWINLLYAGERLDYIEKVIWPNENKK